jgi:hypothetical protein
VFFFHLLAGDRVVFFVFIFHILGLFGFDDSPDDFTGVSEGLVGVGEPVEGFVLV